MKTLPVLPLLVLAAAGAGVLYVGSKRKPGEPMGAAAGRVLVETAADAGVGAVKAVGAQVGIPDTNADECSADLAAGRLWAASFSCPASRFISHMAAIPGTYINGGAIDAPGVYGSTAANAAARADVERVADASTGGATGSW